MNSDLRLFHTLDPFRQSWDVGTTRAAESIGKDREPLAPDYKDPDSSATEQKAVTQQKPQEDKPAGKGVVGGGIGVGVVDVDANGGNPLTTAFSSAFDFPNFGLGEILGGFNRNQWWKGKNVCIEREESSDDNDAEEVEGKKNETETGRDAFSTSIRLSNCFEMPHKYECITKINNHGVVKTFTVRYKCCYGYQREKGANECTKQRDLKPLLETLDDLKTKDFRNMIKSTSLDEKFSEGNYSLFVPTDDAINEYNERIAESNKVDANRRRRNIKHNVSPKEMVLSHAVEGFVDLTEYSNDDVIYSDNNNSSIRINFYPTNRNEKLVTVNCARIKRPNIFASNGIVHVADGVVVPATEDIESIIKNHPRLTNLRKAIENSDIPKKMKPDGHYTVFAPTDEAFAKLDDIQKQKIINGELCAASILKHHFTAHTICSKAIVGNATTHNVQGDLLNLERTDDDEVLFEGKAKIVEADIIATNGVIHLIDQVIIPDSGLSIGSVLNHQNFTKFQEMIEKAGMKEEVNSLQNATAFVPPDRVFESPEAQKILEEANPDKLKEIVRYHFVQGLLPSGDMNNNVMLASKDNELPLRINLYSTLPLFTNIVNRATVNCARVTGFDEKACGSVIHEVNRILVPPTRNILETIEAETKYSTLRAVLKDTEVEKVLQENNRSLTFLAPTDEVFAALEEKDRKMLLENKEKANNVLKNHVLTEVLCCSGVGPQSWGFSSLVSTLGESQVEVGRTGSRIRINRAVVTNCDTVATNGVIHTVNKVIAPRQPQVAAIGGGFFLFDL
ncbi:unnamed protein product [Acanthoscelides obtectus]|uniref:FAS1 domain-containing protein n=1 Tax=Acanthoscelides obtectus TaxID=200917 RepID=A0A9P0PRD2_ACAOB|nr:unnamed protein product [Acanthoscelides obtectus]CAK1642007.1 Transforming growth factor-beta-induced protein ig-h3 [Acanthoscelides obtectus]